MWEAKDVTKGAVCLSLKLYSFTYSCLPADQAGGWNMQFGYIVLVLECVVISSICKLSQEESYNYAGGKKLSVQL